MNQVNGDHPEDENHGLFTQGFYQDTICVFEGKVLCNPMNMSNIPENCQLQCIDLKSAK